MDNIKKVVGIAFIIDGKLLVVQSIKSAKVGKYTFVGGGVEEKETILDAAIRECKEELGTQFNFTRNDFQPVFSFCEHATSDPSKMIYMNILLSNKQIDINLLKPNEEIVKYKLFSMEDDDSILSPSIKDHFIPWAIENKIMYKQDTEKIQKKS